MTPDKTTPSREELLHLCAAILENWTTLMWPMSCVKPIASTLKQILIAEQWHDIRTLPDNGCNIWLLQNDGAVIGPHTAYGGDEPLFRRYRAWMQIVRPLASETSPAPPDHGDSAAPRAAGMGEADQEIEYIAARHANTDPRNYPGAAQQLWGDRDKLLKFIRRQQGGAGG